VTGSDGSFRFLSLNKGDYTVTLSLAGFASIARKIKVTTGENVELEFGTKVSGVAETVEVQAETPLVDSKRRGTAITMTSDELSSVPNARGRAAGRARCDGGPREHRRQRERPAGDVFIEGPAERGEHLEPGRNRGHRHVGHGGVAQLLRLRRVPGDHGHDRRDRPVDGDGRRRHQPHHAATSGTAMSGTSTSASPRRSASASKAYFTLAGEWFNVANSGQVLIRIRQANAAAYNRIDEVLNPSIFRLGAIFGF
jgi:hypothetical protein